MVQVFSLLPQNADKLMAMNSRGDLAKSPENLEFESQRCSLR